MCFFVALQESQNKTVQSLISASVRDIVKQGKMTYLKRLVKSLTSSPVCFIFNSIKFLSFVIAKDKGFKM